MKTIMTPEEVLRLAFPGQEGFGILAITESVILSAEQKFIKPVIGKLYDEILEGKHSTLANDYIKPSLALYVKLLILPDLAVSAGAMGLVRHKGANLSPATEKETALLARRTRTEAYTLAKRAIEHIEDNLDIYTSYEYRDNVLNRLSVLSGIVI